MRVLKDGQSGGGANEGAKAEKTVFEVKLESFEACAKIKIIMEVRRITGVGLKDAKELVEKAPTVVKTGVSKEEGEEIVAKLKALGAKAVLELVEKALGANEGAKVEKTVFEVTLESFDPCVKIRTIKEVRIFTGVGLREAKELVEKAPTVLKTGVSKEEGEEFVEKLKAVGAKAVLESVTVSEFPSLFWYSLFHQAY